MAMFKAFKPSGMEKIARSMGYQGNMQGFQDFLAQDPMRQQKMNDYTNKAMQMAKGGVVKMQQVVAPLAFKITVCSKHLIHQYLLMVLLRQCLRLQTQAKKLPKEQAQ